MKILVIGASGYIGANLVDHLAKEGHQVTAFSRRKRDYTVECKAIYGDITWHTTQEELISQHYDAVVYLVSLDHRQSAESPDLAMRVNVLPLWELLERFAQKGLDKFLYLSTQQVYGKVSGQVKEDYLTDPKNFYGLTHLMGENIVNLYHHTKVKKALSVRLSNSYGVPCFPDTNCWWLVVNDLCKSAYTDKKIKLLSDGSPQRDFIHMSDVVRAIEFLLVTDNDMKQNIYNLSSGTTRSILELAFIVREQYEELFSERIPVLLPDGSEAVPPTNTSPSFTIDNTKLLELGFSSKIKLEKGVKKLLIYLKETQ